MRSLPTGDPPASATGDTCPPGRVTLGWILYRLVTRPHRLIPTIMGWVPRSIKRTLFHLMPIKVIGWRDPGSVVADAQLRRRALAVGGPRYLAKMLMQLVDDFGWRADRPTIFCSSRVLFEKDVVELRRLAGRFNWVILHSDHIARCQLQWLPEELREQRNYRQRIGPQHAEALRSCDSLADELMAMFAARWGMAAVAAANIDYWEEEIYRRYCLRAGIPFLTLSQEHVSIPYYYPFNIRELRAAQYVFDGAGVAVFGERMREMMVESGACQPDQVWVTGAPRLDAWMRPGAFAERPDTITLVTYTEPEYFAPDNFAETLQSFCRAARRHLGSGVHFVVKCKTIRDRQIVQAMAGDTEGCIFDHAVPLFQLMARSRLIVNFNSLAMLEALLSPARLVIPNWGDAARGAEYQQVDAGDPASRRIFAFPESAEELATLIDDAVSAWTPAEDASERRDFLSRYFHMPAGSTASAEVERFVAHFTGLADQQGGAD